MTLGSLIDKYQKVREQKRAAEEKVKEINGQLEEVEGEIFAAMESAGVEKAAGKLASASISSSTVPQVQDWDEFYKYIGRKKYFHLLERRPSATGCRELFDMGQKIPGVEPFVKRKLNIRTV